MSRTFAVEDAVTITKRMHILAMQRRGGACPRWLMPDFPLRGCWCERHKPDPNGKAIDCPQKPDGWAAPEGVTAQDYAE